MKSSPLRTSVIGSYPFPGWLEHACQHLDAFGSADRAEMQDDAVITAVNDQLVAGLDVITDGEQTRFDFNLSFYGHLHGLELESASPRRFGPPAHDQRGKHSVTESIQAPRGLGVVEEYKRLRRLAPNGPTLKASVPGPLHAERPFTNQRSIPHPLGSNGSPCCHWCDASWRNLVAAGCQEICVDEPSMSCYAYKEDTARFVDIFNRTVEPVVGKVRLATHLCFGNYKGRGRGATPHRSHVPSIS